MNIKTAKNINNDLDKLLSFYIASGRPADSIFTIAMTPANKKNLAYYYYQHYISRGFNSFEAYLEKFESIDIHNIVLAAGMGPIKVRFIEYTPD